MEHNERNPKNHLYASFNLVWIVSWNENTRNIIAFSFSKISFINIITAIDSANDQNSMPRGI